MKFPVITILTCLIVVSLVFMSYCLGSGSLLIGNAITKHAEEIGGRVLGASESNLPINEDVKNFGNMVERELKKISLSLSGQASEASVNLPASENKPPREEIIEQYELDANCGAVLDVENNNILFDKQANREWPLASLTKLITAIVFLEHNPGWDSVYTIKGEDRREGGRIYLFTGEKVRVKDLFYLSLVGSGNTETVALVHSTGMTENIFVEKMNEKAQSLNLNNTKFFDVTGLNNKNVSTARDIVRFTQAALLINEISKATITKKYEFWTLEGKNKVAYNTDDLLNNFPENGIRIVGGKTGYLELAGYCFVGKFVDHQGKEMISVVLGSKDRYSRFTEAKNLVEWTYENYIWK